jgi:hypothetical protein
MMFIYPLSSLKELIVVRHDDLTEVEQGEIRTEKRTSGAKGSSAHSVAIFYAGHPTQLHLLILYPA